MKISIESERIQWKHVDNIMSFIFRHACVVYAVNLPEDVRCMVPWPWSLPPFDQYIVALSMAVVVTFTKLTNGTPWNLNDMANPAIRTYHLGMIFTIHLWQHRGWLFIEFCHVVFFLDSNSISRWQFTTCTLLGLIWFEIQYFMKWFF